MQCYNAVIQHLILKVDTTNTETVTRSERHEEDAFLDEVMNSDVMKETMRCRQTILDIIFNKQKYQGPKCAGQLQFQVSGSEAAFHKIGNRVQKVAQGVLVHPLQQRQQNLGIKVGKKF